MAGGLAASGGVAPRGQATCFASKHLVPLWNSLPCSALYGLAPHNGSAAGHCSAALMPRSWHLPKCRSRVSALASLSPTRDGASRSGVGLLTGVIRDGRGPGTALAETPSQQPGARQHMQRAPGMVPRPASSPDRRSPARSAARPEGEQPRLNGVTAPVPGPSERGLGGNAGAIPPHPHDAVQSRALRPATGRTAAIRAWSMRGV